MKVHAVSEERDNPKPRGVGGVVGITPGKRSTSGLDFDHKDCRTHSYDDANGSGFVVRAVNGEQSVTVRSRVDTPEAAELLPSALCAYPCNFKEEGKETWSKPVMMFWIASLSKWAPASKLVPQTAKNPKPPEYSPISTLYWVDKNGCVSINNGKKVYRGLRKRARDKYDKFKIYRFENDNPVSSEKDIAVPFSIELADDAFATNTKIFNGDKLVFLTDYRRDYAPVDGKDKSPNIAFPPQITDNGKTVALNVAMSHYWADPFAGYYSLKKYYYWNLVNLEKRTPDRPTGAIADAGSGVGELTATTWQDGVGESKSEDYLPVTNGFGDLKWHVVYEVGGWPAALLYCNWNTTISWPLGDLYKTTKVSLTGNQIDIINRRAYTKLSRDISNSRTTEIGNVVDGSLTKPVSVTTTNNAHLLWRVDGQQRVAQRDLRILDNLAPPHQNGGAALGDSEKRKVENSVFVEQSSTNRVTVSVGGFSVNTYEFEASTNGSATRTTVITSAQPLLRNNAGDWFTHSGPREMEGEFGARWWQDPEWQNGDAPNDYIGIMFNGAKIPETGFGDIAAAVASWPRLNDKYAGLIVKSENDHDSFPPFITTLSGNAAGRTILACDLSMDFIAYIEAEVSWRATITAKPDANWRRSIIDDVAHNVAMRVVIKYRDQQFVRPLISNVLITKPPKLYKTEATNIATWPHENTVDDGMFIYANDLGITGVSSLQGIDGVFNAQGSCPDYAGYTKKEEDAFSSNSPGEKRLGGHGMIFSKRIKLREQNFDWLFNLLQISEGKRMVGTEPPTEAELRPYYYSDELYTAICKTTHLIEFDHLGLRAWPESIKVANENCAINPSPDRDATCYRV